ncbi:PhzF family phenazine biosynthesis protein [Thermomonas haemolytica]|uniref:PhzF family phenazine biosynthesis protein n=1 Tax=Thermomonas haemolytica TaxID=141949 RepID=A0A4R3N352_9GAMM|nr:PhzF family phenazine biosynthesis protein [Thermomonas haemolytica]TCT23548.1 PhzF family phenazine biosynthesis protein [Thermomonas haemolytica]TNY30421.1 phenazine biosynthesis protein [Thermomonas haemolytica]
MIRRYLQLDVFAARPGQGNPLGVVLDAQGLDGAAMQSLAAWLNLSETVFFLPPEAGADYRIRIFTPGSELPFAGHPSVGAAWAVVQHRLAQPSAGRLVQQCGAGNLPVRIEMQDAQLLPFVRSPRAREVARHDGALPNGLDALIAPGTQAMLWDNGPRWWLLEAASAAALRAFRPDFSALAAWTNATAATGVAVYAFEASAQHALAVRAFCPGDAVNVPEDPVTGSANAAIAACLHRQGRLPGADGTYVASQGRELGRDGRVLVRVDGDGEVWIGGQVQQVIEGRLDW